MTDLIKIGKALLQIAQTLNQLTEEDREVAKRMTVVMCSGKNHTPTTLEVPVVYIGPLT